MVNGIAAHLHAPNTDPLKDTKYDFPRDHIGYGRQSLNPAWPREAKIAVSFVINYEEGAERTPLNGDEQSENRLWEQADIAPRYGERAINVESDYDYGSRVGVWRLLDTFEKHRFPVTCFAVGMAFEKNPEAVQAFTQNGHEIASHAYRWIDYHGMPPAQEKQYIIHQLQSPKETTGRYPVGWYYGRLSSHSKTLVHEVFEEMGLPLLYVSDSYADDIPYWVDVPAEQDLEVPKGMLMIPYTYDCNDLKYCSPHGWGSVAAFESYLKNAFDILYSEGLSGKPKMMTVGLHCRISGKPGRLMAVKNFVEYIASNPDVWVCTREDIALHFRAKFPYQRGKLA